MTPSRKFTALAFLALLLIAPLADLLGPEGDTSAIEKRSATPRPTFAPTRQYLADISAWYAENFSLRPALIRLHNLLRLRLADESASTGVRKGREGWLYYNKENSLDDHLNAIPLDGGDLLRMKLVLARRAAWLKERGIAFLVVAAPNKETIYPEHLPGPDKVFPMSRLDQLASMLAHNPDINFLDLRAPLLAAKSEARLYHRTDTHWNDYGAFIGAQAILARLHQTFPAIRVPQSSDYTPQWRPGEGGDLADMLALADTIPEKRVDMIPNFTPRASNATRTYADPVTMPGRAMIVRETGDSRLPRALLFRDSFSSALVPFLSENLQSSVYIWTFSFFPDIVTQEKPDVVILEFVERYIFALTVDDHPLPPLKAQP